MKESRLMKVKGKGGDPGCAREGLLHPVTVVHVQVDVEHPLEAFLQFMDGKDNVISVAEPRSAVSVCMMPSPIPIDGSPSAVQQMVCSREGCPTDQLGPGEHVRKDWTIVAETMLLLLLTVSPILDISSGQEVKIVFCVEDEKIVKSGRDGRNLLSSGATFSSH